MRGITTTILSLFILQVFAQTSVSFNNLGNATFQNNYQNPALIPSQDLFIGIPVISGIHLHSNSKTSYNETFTKEGETTLVDISKILKAFQNQNMVSAHTGVNLFHVGIKMKNASLISFSARERVEVDLLSSKELVDYLWNGNEKYVNQDINVAEAGVKAMHFREFGFGYAKPVNNRMDFGVRAKFLLGIADVSLPGNFSATLNSNGEAFQLDAKWNNFAIRSSGLNILRDNEDSISSIGSHLIMNKNTGFAVDLGLKYRLSRAHTITASLLDIGFINWKVDIENRFINDTTFNYSGVSLDSLGTVRQTIKDSLVANFRTSTNFDPYRGWLPLKVYGSWIYHYSRNTDIYFSGGVRLIQRRLKMLYGIGLTKRFGSAFMANVTATKLPQQFVNLGASFVVNGGPVQFYIAAEQIASSFSLPDKKAFDFRMGINLAIGSRDGDSRNEAGKRKVAGAKGVDTNEFLGQRVVTKKREGIYSIIKRQKKRELKDNKSPQKGRVNRKSLNGHSGKKNTNKN